MFRPALIGAACVVLVAAGCGGGDDKSTTASAPPATSAPDTAGGTDPVIGSWKGTGTERAADGSTRKYPVSIDIATLDPNGSAGRVDYTSFPCGGTLRYVRHSGSDYQFREFIHYGKRKCSRSGSITVSLAGPDSLQWSWVGEGGLTVEATLKRT